VIGGKEAKGPSSGDEDGTKDLSGMAGCLVLQKTAAAQVAAIPLELGGLPPLLEREQAPALQRGRRPLFMLSRRLHVGGRLCDHAPA
jgi:hypothetical protein